MSEINWRSEKRRISELIPADYNPRELTRKQAQDLESSLKRFNLADPIVVNSNNTIIGGHQRINVLKQQGDVEVDVRIPDRLLTREEEQELNLRLNKNLGQWDFDMLAQMDMDLLKTVGFDSGEIEKIIHGGNGSEGETPEVEFTEELMLEHNYVVLYFDNIFDWEVAKEKFGLKKVKDLIPRKGQPTGVGRVVDGKEFLDRIS